VTDLTFELVTLEGIKFSEDCYEVMLPTPQGQIAILPHHIPLVSIASAGVVSIRKNPQDSDDRLQHFASSGGLVEVEGKRVRLLADSAESAEDIDELEVKEALERAQEIQKKATSQVALADATATLERQTARLKVAELKRRRKTH
jgi:F-type H+-transporting ATPase subunit epsilon